MSTKSPLGGVLQSLSDLWHSTGQMRQAAEQGKCIKCAWHEAEDGSRFCEFCAAEFAKKGAHMAAGFIASKTEFFTKNVLEELFKGGFRPPGSGGEQ